MKTIIAIYGRKDEGKSETIKNVCRLLLSNFPNSIPSIPIREIDYNSDILLTIKLGSILIGIESQGDPNSRMINDDTIKDLANQNCDIIVCATRTGGMTVAKVDNIALNNNNPYRVIWKSSYFNSGCNNDVLNYICAEEIINLIKSIIITQV
jgi:Cdc6-like AAA superfamily ATPase